MASTTYGVHENEIALAKAVKELSKKIRGAVTAHQIAEHLKWKDSLVYKYVEPAVGHQLVRYEVGTREKNIKPLLPVPGKSTRFLPPPPLVFQQNEEIGPFVEYVDPTTGKVRRLERIKVWSGPTIHENSPITCSSISERLLDVKEAAALLNVPRSWIYQHVRPRAEQTLPHFKLGKYIRFSAKALTHWLETCHWRRRSVSIGQDSFSRGRR